MNKLFVYFLIFFSIISCNETQNISVMTYNIRYGLADDGENSWKYRKENMVNLIKSKFPDFLGTQEGLPFQLNFINEVIPDYKFIGKERDGKGKGESTAIFYNYRKFELLEQNTFWLSPTQNKVSIGWDAAYPRICTYGLFKSIKSGKLFWVINTHFDHMGVKAREESSLLILDKIKEVNIPKYPLIFMGDLNAEPKDTPILNIKKLLDDAMIVSINIPFGPKGTFNAFQFNLPVTKKIDYIFISKGNAIKVNSHVILSNSNNSKYPSDHFPIIVELTIN
jgi:endonuclease/exonuclease/phosphatase family metal-dependent hydrolase